MYTCMLLQVTTSYKSCSIFLADRWFPFSMFCVWHLSWLFREILTWHSLQSNGFSPLCDCICIVRSLPWTHHAPHFLGYVLLQGASNDFLHHTLCSWLFSFSPVCILLCCFRLPLLTNPALHSLQINCFPPVCVCIQHFSWLQSYTASQVDRQSLGCSALPYTVYTLHPACLGELTWGSLPSR